jgi:pimeloyl-ACP methyl ester carboxylesterase
MRRILPVIALVLALIAPAVAVARPAGHSTPGRSWSELRHQFDYQRERIRVADNGVTLAGGAVVHDITYRAPGQDPVSAYLVMPLVGGRHPAAMFLHWLDTPEESTRAEFLDEAESLAAGPAHVISLLPQLTFPFDYFPVGDVRDKDSIIKQVIQLRRGLDLLDSLCRVASSHVAVVGHDYGAMYATLLSAVDARRVRTTVIMAADSTMSNWFVKFFLDLPADQVAPYTQMLSSVDPITYIGREPHRLLLQYATDDFYIPLAVAASMHDAAPPSAVYRTYDIDHSMRTPAAQTDRDRFLTRTLRLRS